MSKIKYVVFFIIGILSLCKGNRNLLAEEWMSSAQAKENLYKEFPEIVYEGCSACFSGFASSEPELS